MTVEILRLRGLDLYEAEQAAVAMLDLVTGPRDMRNLLVLDDTALLAEHEPVYVRIDNSGRVERLLCVAVGPCSGPGRVLRLPGNLGGTQGSPVLWVSDPTGMDWRVAIAAMALGHPPGKTDGLASIIELLSVQDMFDRVHKIFTDRVPGRVASPGLWLAGQDDEAETFAAGLALAIQGLCDSGSGSSGPFQDLLPERAGGASLADDGPLARYRDEIVAASEDLAKPAGFAGRFRRQAGLQARLVEAGDALADLRDLVVQLLKDAHTTGELTTNQRREITDAGVRFPPAPRPTSTRSSAVAADQPRVYRCVVKAVEGGDTLPLVSRRLTLTDREMKRRGSAGYLQEVVERCPPALLERLATSTEHPSRRPNADPGHDLSLGEARRAASALEDLVLFVANREWSPVATARGEVARIRVALDGASKALTEHAAAGRSHPKVRGARLSRLAGILASVLHDLVFRVLAAECAQPSASGQEAFGAAKERAAGHLADWTKHVLANGLSTPPPFATSSGRDAVLYAVEDDVTEIRDALLHRPADEMWQLCSPGDIGMLNVTTPPEAIRFASRMSKDALNGAVPGDEPVWTSSGSHAGVLRLVALRPGCISSGWGEQSAAAEVW